MRSKFPVQPRRRKPRPATSRAGEDRLAIGMLAGDKCCMRAVISGASRGIGLEFAKQLLARGDAVDASAREPRSSPGLELLLQRYPKKLRVHPCDVGDADSIRSLASSLGGRPVDLLINNAGISGAHGGLEEVDREKMLQTFRINAAGAVSLTGALLPLLRESSAAKVVHISSRMGSISETSGGSFAYRMSKAALNMAARCMSVELKERRIISVALSPGWVQTDMGGGGAPTPVEESVQGMLRVIDGLTLDLSGSFLDYRGAALPW